MIVLHNCNKDQRVENPAYGAMLQTLLSHSTKQISVDSLKKMDGRVVLLDTRTRPEFDVSHLGGARHVGYTSFDTARISHLPKDTTIVTYCSVGYRSEKIANILTDMGFRNVRNLYGGIFEWKNQGHAVVNSSGITDSVHAFNRVWGVWLNRGKKIY